MTLDGKHFFSEYACIPDARGADGRFTCSMYTKALLSVFKGRLYDPLGRDGAVERCEVSLQDQNNEAYCRFIVKMICNQGITKTYKLTYEAVDVMHALFDRSVAQHRWSMHSGAIREYIEYFGTKTELLDIFTGEDGRCVFKSYTEKISDGKEILKHPLVTAVAVNTSDFEDFSVQAGLHIVISVRDFKAIVSHADTLKTSLKAYYSAPFRPMQFSYGCDGLVAEFTLMTSGDYTGAPPTSTPAPQQHLATPQQRSRQASHAPSTTSERTDTRSMRSEMLPPVQPASRRDQNGRLRNPGSRQSSSASSQSLAAPTQAESEDKESLFVPHNDARMQEEEDAAWAPMDYDKEETLGWDASANNDVAAFPTFRDTGIISRTSTTDSSMVIEPTQRLSEIRGLW